MPKKLLFCCLAILLVLLSCKDKRVKTEVEGMSNDEMPQTAEISFNHDTIHKKITVLIDGAVFTNYIYDGKTPKPILYPLITKSGKTLTRGFPYEPRPNERVDHPHHVGHWMNYGDVNGFDFWNNSYAISEEEKHKYGTIYHREILEDNADDGVLRIKASWRSPLNAELLEEVTEFTFSEEANTRIIDRSTTLKAMVDVSFKDNKEGMFAVRVARGLELPTDKPAIFTDAQGNATTVAASNNEGVNGDYLASEGLTGNKVWGTRNRWVTLEGVIEDEPVSITIIDNTNNVGYPTYWHARDYGLFAANPLGQAIFSEGKEKLNFELRKGSSVTFKYRMLIHNGEPLPKESVEVAFEDFNN